jgi:hypothetical protein
MTLEKELKRASDPIFMTTKNEKPSAKCQKEDYPKDNNEADILQMGLHSRQDNKMSNYSNYEYFDIHSHITTATLSTVMMTMIAILMTYYHQKNYCTWRLSTDATFGMIISLMHNYPQTNLLYNKKSQQLITQKDKILLRKEQILATFHTIKINHTQQCSSLYVELWLEEQSTVTSTWLPIWQKIISQQQTRQKV